MSQVIYVSEYSGYDPLRSDGKSIVKGGFQAYPVFDPVKGLVKKGVIVLDSEKNADVIKELEAFPDFGKGFVKVAKLPTKANAEGNIISGVRTGHEDQKPAVDTAQIKKEIGDKLKRYYELKALVIKADGSIKANAKDEDITELENLEQELFPK